jgi:hypothetical protein
LVESSLLASRMWFGALLKIQIFEFKLELEVPRGGIGEITWENTLGDIGGWSVFFLLELKVPRGGIGEIT